MNHEDERNDAEFDAWLTGQAEEFDAAMREGVNSAGVLQVIKERAEVAARREIEEKVAVAAVTGQPPQSAASDWPRDAWETVDEDIAQLPSSDANVHNYQVWLTSQYPCLALERSGTAVKRKMAVDGFADDLRELSSTVGRVPVPRGVRDTWMASLDARYDAAYSMLGRDPRINTAVPITAGQVSILDRIVGLVVPLAYRYARAKVSICGASLDEADALARKALLALIENLSSYRPGEPFLRFTYTVLQREVCGEPPERAQHVHPGRRRKTWSWLCREHSTEQDVHSRLVAQLSGLADNQREVVVLRVVVGLSAEETATALGWTEGSVQAQQRLALARLRHKISDSFDSFA